MRMSEIKDSIVVFSTASGCVELSNHFVLCVCAQRDTYLN